MPPHRRRLLGLIAGLFLACSITYALQGKTLATFGSAALEWGVKNWIAAATVYAIIVRILGKLAANQARNYIEVSHA